MAELTTIARPYAEAAFRMAREHNAFPAWSQTLGLVSGVAADPQMAAALDNPQLTAADKEALLLKVCGERIDPLGRNFVRVLVEADRIAVLPQITTMFEALKDAAEGVAKARIDTAFALSDAELADITAALEKHFGQADRGDGDRRSRAHRRRPHHRRRHRDRRLGAGEARGDGDPATGLISKLP